MVKLLALDLDGTLLNNQNQVSAYNREMVRRAREQGIYILLISGRPYRHIQNVARELGLENCMIVAFGGADIREFPSGRSLRTHCLTRENTDLLFSLADQIGCYMQIFTLDGDFYFREHTKYGQIYGDYFQHPGSLLTREIYEAGGFSKAMFIMELEQVPDFLRTIRPKLPKELYATISFSFIVDVYRSESDKGAALRFVAEHCGISKEEIAAMGDEVNDLALFREAGLKVAMGNAAQPLKDQADLLAPTNEEDGVGKIIRQLLEK